MFVRFQAIMRNLVRRYVTVQQRRAECGGVTEDDVNEIKQDVSAFRCELVEILRNSGMNTSTANAGAPGTCRRRTPTAASASAPSDRLTSPQVAEAARRTVRRSVG